MTETDRAVLVVADLMALAARTAPKGKGLDTLVIRVLTGKDLAVLAGRMEEIGKLREMGFFLRDAKNIRDSAACVLIGSAGTVPAGINCGACGYPVCTELEAAFRGRHRAPGCFAGPNCAVRMADLGIAVGSAAKTAQIHNADNRIMFSAGVSAIDLGLLGDTCTTAYAIPLSATGKNIYFDRTHTK